MIMAGFDGAIKMFDKPVNIHVIIIIHNFAYFLPCNKYIKGKIINTSDILRILIEVGQIR